MRKLFNYVSPCIAALVTFLSAKASGAPFLFHPQCLNNRITFSFNSGPGQYTVQYSSNLVSWSNLLSTNLAGGNINFAFPIPVGQIGFYRVSQATNTQTAPPHQNFTVYPSTLNFFDPATSTPVPSQTLTISNSSTNAIFLVLSNNCPISGDPASDNWVGFNFPLGPVNNILYPSNVATVVVSLNDTEVFAGTTNFGSILISDTSNSNNPVIVPVTLEIAAVYAQFSKVNADAWAAAALNCDYPSSDDDPAPTNAPSDSLFAYASGGCYGNTSSASASASYTLVGSSAHISGSAESTLSGDPGESPDSDCQVSLYFTIAHKVSFSARWSATDGASVGFSGGGSTQGSGSGAIVSGSLPAGTYSVGGSANSNFPEWPESNYQMDIEIRDGPGP